MNIDTYTIALIFAIMGIGVFISFRILNITDLTIEASFGFGAALCGLMCKANHPYLGLLLAFLGGMFAGLITSILHTKLKINAILSGILTLTAFYSVNLIVTNSNTVMAFPQNTIFPETSLMKLITMIIIFIIIGLLFILLFRSRLGLSIRACGDNEDMAKTQSIPTDTMKIIGLMLSNGLVALAGSLLVQFQGAYFANMEKGVMVIAVATIIIGEVLILRKHNINLIILGILGGSIIYRVLYSLLLNLDFFKPRSLQLIQTSFLIIILFAGIMKDRIKQKNDLKKKAKSLEDESC